MTPLGHSATDDRWDRDRWIAEFSEGYDASDPTHKPHPNELPSEKKEAALLAAARAAATRGDLYTSASSLGYKAYDISGKKAWYAHGFWIADFLKAHGFATADSARSLIILDPEALSMPEGYEDGAGRRE